jgi:RNA recognition motif-containing protein
MNIFVAKLDYSIDGSFLQDLFEEYGEVSSAKVIMDKFTGKSKGFGFVEMPDSGEGQAAIDALDGREFQGRAIVVKVANPRQDNNRGGGGGGYNRGRY